MSVSDRIERVAQAATRAVENCAQSNCASETVAFHRGAEKAYWHAMALLLGGEERDGEGDVGVQFDVWRGTANHPHGGVHLSFRRADGLVVRLRLQANDALVTVETLLDWLKRQRADVFQSAMSSEIPSADGSPKPGQCE